MTIDARFCTAWTHSGHQVSSLRRDSLDHFEGLWACLCHHHVVAIPNTSEGVHHTKDHNANLKFWGQIAPLLTEHVIFDPTDAE